MTPVREQKGKSEVGKKYLQHKEPTLFVCRIYKELLHTSQQKTDNLREKKRPELVLHKKGCSNGQ